MCTANCQNIEKKNADAVSLLSGGDDVILSQGVVSLFCAYFVYISR